MRPATTFASAFAAASALTGVASAQALFTTLNSATVSLSSLNGSPVSSSSTYTGPATSLNNVPMPAMSAPGTGSANVLLLPYGSLVGFNIEWFSPIPGAPFVIQMTWDVTFNSSLGGVEFIMDSFSGTQSLTVTPFGGSASNLTVGDYLSNGRYTFQFDFTETTATSGVLEALGFQETGGTAVPLPGAAGLAALGLAGLSGRRRR